MAIDAIKRLPNYSVTQSNETSEDQRKKERESQGKKRKVSSEKSEKLDANAVLEKVENPTLDSALQSQPLDTKAMVSLLEAPTHAPTPASTQGKLVVKLFESVKRTSLFQEKKVNKSL